MSETTQSSENKTVQEVQEALESLVLSEDSNSQNRHPASPSNENDWWPFTDRVYWKSEEYENKMLKIYGTNTQSKINKAAKK